MKPGWFHKKQYVTFDMFVKSPLRRHSRAGGDPERCWLLDPR